MAATTPSDTAAAVLPAREPASPARTSLARGLSVALAFGALALFPLVGDDYYNGLVAKIMILAIFALSLELLVGQTGLVSFGHAAFFGIGAYAVALATPKNAWQFSEFCAGLLAAHGAQPDAVIRVSTTRTPTLPRKARSSSSVLKSSCR